MIKAILKCIYTFQAFRKSTTIACFEQKIVCITHFIYSIFIATVIECFHIGEVYFLLII